MGTTTAATLDPILENGSDYDLTGLNAMRSIAALTPGHTEELRIVPNGLLEEYLSGIVTHIVEAAREHGETLIPENIHVRTCDMQGHAYCLHENGEPYIIIDKHLFELMTTEDEFAFILAHEIGHSIYRNLHPERGKTVSVDEETFCDRFGVRAIEWAGYSRGGAANAFKALIEEERAQKTTPLADFVNKLLRLGDAHIKTVNRWAQAKEDFTGIERQMEGSDEIGRMTGSRPVPSYILAEAKSLHHRSFIDAFVAEHDFNALPLTAQLDLLMIAYPQLNNGARYADFAALFDRIGGESPQGSPEVLERVDTLVNTLVEDCLNGNREAGDLLRRIYDHASFLCVGVYPERLPLGPYKKIASLIAQVAEAQSPEEISRLLENYAEDRKIFDPLCRTIFDPFCGGLYWPPEYQDKLLEAAKTDSTGRVALLFWDTYCHRNRSDPTLPTLFFAEMPIPILKKLPLLVSDNPKRQRELASEIFIWEGRRGSLWDFSELKKNPNHFFHGHSDLLIYPQEDELARYPMGSPLHGLSLKEARKLHLAWMERLCQEFSVLAASRNRYDREIVRDYFLTDYSRAWHSVKCYCAGDARALSSMPPNHPLVNFVREHQNFFSPRERLIALGNLNPNLPFPPPIDWCEQHASFTAPCSLRELKAFFKKIYAPPSHLPWWLVKSPRDQTFGQSVTGTLIANIARHPSTPSGEHVHDNADFLRMVHTEMGGSCYGCNELHTALQERLFPEGAVSAQLPTDLSAEDLVRIYHVCGRSVLFKTPEQRAAMGKQVIDAVRNVRNASKRRAILKELLFESDPITERPLEEAAVELLARTVRQQMGKDSGSAFYLKRLRAAVVDIVGKEGTMPRLTHRHTIARFNHVLADTIVAQREAAYFLRDFGETKGENKALWNYSVNGAIEVLSIAGKDEQRARETLDFLWNPPTPESIEAFRVCTDRWKAEELPNLVCTDRWKAEELPNLEPTPPDEKQADLTRLDYHDLHTHFWGLTVEERAYTVKQILINPERLYENEEQAHAFAADLVLSRLFPVGALEPGTAQYQSAFWAREIARAFLASVDESERGFVLGAMVAASEGLSGSETAPSPGRSLKLILEHLGPAYIKLGQAIHSYQGTPEDIRVELADLKSHAARPARWDLYEMIESLPSDLRRSIRYLGENVGSASFNVVTLFRDVLHRRRALGMLRPHARNRAYKGFRELEQMVDYLTERHESFGPYRDDWLSIVRHAREMTDIETDMRVGSEQHVEARKLYNNAVVVADGRLFRFNTAKWRSIAQEGRVMDEAPGVPFDKLPENTRAQLAYKKAVAKAIFMMEMRIILGGGRFDCDRHEAQYHVAGHVITVVDHGGMSMGEPSEEDKAALGQFIGEAIREHPSGSGVMERIVSRLQASSLSDDYRQRLEKGLLALSFTMNYVSPEDVLAIASTLLFNGHVDDTIEDAMFEALGDDFFADQGIDPSALQNISMPVRAIAGWRKAGAIILKNPGAKDDRVHEVV